jgi:hypothetical protein
MRGGMSNDPQVVIWNRRAILKVSREESSVKAFFLAMWAKGGEGSGNFGHVGRPGEVGGSGHGDEATSHAALLEHLTGQAAKPAGPTTKVTFEGEDDALAKAGMSREALAKLCDLGIPGTEINIMYGYMGQGNVGFYGEWFKDGKLIGRVDRELIPDMKMATLNQFSATRLPIP